MNIETTKIEQEKKVIEVMIRLFCARKHGIKTGLCSDCKNLLDYAYKRLDKCPFGEEKSTCRKCTIHCYEKVMREKMRQVMGFSGPRMVFYHPFIALRHFMDK